MWKLPKSVRQRISSFYSASNSPDGNPELSGAVIFTNCFQQRVIGTPACSIAASSRKKMERSLAVTPVDIGKIRLRSKQVAIWPFAKRLFESDQGIGAPTTFVSVRRVGVIGVSGAVAVCRRIANESASEKGSPCSAQATPLIALYRPLMFPKRCCQPHLLLRI